ncbi:MAG: flagellar basal body-associated FliL family protein [Aliishimia sp.]
MSDEVTDEDDVPTKASKLPLILGLVLALVGGGGGFYATWSGMVLGADDTASQETPVPEMDAIPDIAFVELEPLIVAISGAPQLSHLRFRAQLEVPSTYRSDVELLEPRIIDVLNGYLRALRTSDIEDSSSLTRLRAQMLRRIQVVIGPGRVNDLLIMEFVIN